MKNIPILELTIIFQWFIIIYQDISHKKHKKNLDESVKKYQDELNNKKTVIKELQKWSDNVENHQN